MHVTALTVIAAVFIPIISVAEPLQQVQKYPGYT